MATRGSSSVCGPAGGASLRALQEEPVDPQAESTFAASRLDRSLRHQGRHQTLWQYYRELLRLRRETPAICRRSREQSWVAGFEAERILLSRSEFDGSGAWAVLSFHDSADDADGGRSISAAAVPQAGIWCRQFDSAAAQWQGPGALAAEVWRPGEPLTLAPPQCRALRARGVSFQLARKPGDDQPASGCREAAECHERIEGELIAPGRAQVVVADAA